MIFINQSLFIGYRFIDHHHHSLFTPSTPYLIRIPGSAGRWQISAINDFVGIPKPTVVGHRGGAILAHWVQAGQNTWEWSTATGSRVLVVHHETTAIQLLSLHNCWIVIRVRVPGSSSL